MSSPLGYVIEMSLFERPTLEVAPLLLGVEITFHDCSGIIVETEAYTDDPASHWITRPVTGRLLGESHGRIYLYTIYGIHRCLNFTSDIQAPGAVLIRALEPIDGIAKMRQRRGVTDLHNLTNGPAKLVQAMDIDAALSGEPVLDHLTMRRAKRIDDAEIATSARIGISKGRALPWRFFIKDNPFVSRRRG